METWAGDAGEEKIPQDIARTGRMPAGPGQTRGKKKPIRKLLGLKFHRKHTTVPNRSPRFSAAQRREAATKEKSMSCSSEPNLEGGSFAQSEHESAFKRLAIFVAWCCWLDSLTVWIMSVCLPPKGWQLCIFPRGVDVNSHSFKTD